MMSERTADFLFKVFIAIIIVFLVAMVCASAEPQNTDASQGLPFCASLIEQAGVAGEKITPQNVGKLYGAALSRHILVHKGTTLQDRFTRADILAAAKDIADCFQLKIDTDKPDHG